MSITAPAVEVSGLVVRYGSVVAVNGVDLHAGQGEVVAVLGRNGAGKTSTIEAIEGYRRAAAGTVRVIGLDPQDADGQRALSKRIGVMLQRGGVYPAMGAAEALHLFASYYPDPEDPDALLRRLGLVGATARTPWRRLSGGEQQRLSLALALIGRPEVVFLDEPTAGVDPHGRQVIRAVVAELRAAGVCVLLTTHELDEAERMADRVVIIDRGRVLAAGTPAELTAADRLDEPSGGLDLPPGHLDQPPGHLDQPPRHLDQPPGHLDQPPRHLDQPPDHLDQPPDHLDHPPDQPPGRLAPALELPLRGPTGTGHGGTGRPARRGRPRGSPGRVPGRRPRTARHRGRPDRLAGRATTCPCRPARRPPPAGGRLPPPHLR